LIGRRDGCAAPSPAVDSVAATVGDAAQLLGIQMDQVTGMEVLIAADRPAGRPIQPR
jgi:hypothetical protein